MEHIVRGATGRVYRKAIAVDPRGKATLENLAAPSGVEGRRAVTCKNVRTPWASQLFSNSLNSDSETSGAIGSAKFLIRKFNFDFSSFNEKDQNPALTRNLKLFAPRNSDASLLVYRTEEKYIRCF